MAIKFQYNKISLQEMQKQLKVRLDALPVIKYKEAILRTEAEKEKKKMIGLEQMIVNKVKHYGYMNMLWQEFQQNVITVSEIPAITCSCIHNASLYSLSFVPIQSFSFFLFLLQCVG